MEQITTAQIRQHLTDILSSSSFQASQRLKDFLSYIVNSTLAGKGKDLKAYTIATEVFKLGKNFDPRTNPLIRTEAGRLRSKLDHYYLENPNSPIRISIPKGGYLPIFCRFSQNEANGKPTQKYSFTEQKISQQEYKASLLVLPFSNINKTNEVERFISGLFNEVVTGLTRFRELKIVDLSTSRQIAEILSFQPGKPEKPLPRFVLNGSVQHEEDNFKVWVNLIDSNGNQNMWSEKFRASLSELSLLEIQEEIADSIVNSIADDFGLLQRTLLKEYTAGSSVSSDIQEATLLYYHWTTVLTRKDFKKALESVERASENHPEHIPMQAMLADLYASNHQWGYGLVENSMEKSLQIASRAINLDPNCQLAHLAMCLNLYLRGDTENFVQTAKRAIEINPASTNVYSAIASWYGLSGIWDTSIEMIERIMQASPQYPGWCYSIYAMYYLCRNDYGKSLEAAKKISMPSTFWDMVLRLSAAGFLDDKKESLLAFQELMEAFPDFMENGLTYLSNNLTNQDLLVKTLEGMDKSGFFNILKKYQAETVDN